MIEVYGNVVLKAGFSVELDMTEEEFEALSERQQDELIDLAIDWDDVTRGSEIDEIDVWEYRKIKKMTARLKRPSVPPAKWDSNKNISTNILSQNGRKYTWKKISSLK